MCFRDTASSLSPFLLPPVRHASFIPILLFNVVSALMRTHWQKFEKLEDMRKFRALLLVRNNLYSWKPLSWEHRWISWILACYPKMRPLSTGPHSPHREDDLFWRIKFPFPRRRNIHCNERAHNATNNAACAAEYKIWISNARPCSESRIDWFLIRRSTIQNRVINLLQNRNQPDKRDGC